MELRQSWSEVEERGLQVVGLALEETKATDTKKFLKAVGDDPPFPLACDVSGEQTKRLAPTTGYLIDAEGVVQQVFPMQTYARGRLPALLHEIDRVLASARTTDG